MHDVGKDLAGDPAEDVVLLVVKPHEVIQLGLEGVHERLEAREILHLSRAGAQLFARGGEHAVMHRDVQHLGHDEHAEGVDAAPAGQVEVQAAGQRVVPRLLQGHALGHQTPDVAPVADEGGHADAGLHQLGGLHHQVLGRAVRHPDGDGILRHPHPVRRLDDQVAQLVGGVGAVLLHARDDEVVPARHAGPLVPLLGSAVDEIELHDLDPQALQQLQHVLVREGAGVDVLPVIGVHELVEAPAGRRAVGDHHPVEEEVLQRVPEVPAGVFRDPVAGVRHPLQLRPADGIGGLFRLLRAGVPVPVVHPDHGAQGDDDGLEILALVEGIGVVIGQFPQLLLGVVQRLADALADDLGIVRHEEAQADAHAPAEAGAAGAAPLGLVLPRRAQNAGADEGPQVPVVVETALPLVDLAALSGPEGVVAPQLRPVFGADRETAVRAHHRIQVVVVPEGAPDRGLHAVGDGGDVAGDQFVVVDVDRAFVQVVRGGVGVLQHHGQALVPFPGLDEISGLLRADGVFVRLQRVLHPRDAFRHADSSCLSGRPSVSRSCAGRGGLFLDYTTSGALSEDVRENRTEGPRRSWCRPQPTPDKVSLAIRKRMSIIRSIRDKLSTIGLILSFGRASYAEQGS